jgi:hypothetical protein
MIGNASASALNLICLLLKRNLPAVYCCDYVLKFNWASTTDVKSNGIRDTVMVMGMKLKLKFHSHLNLNFKAEFTFCF